MKAFPFTDAEWDPLKPLAVSILNASQADDDVLVASLQLEMLDQLDALRARHGEHPVLLETIADYTEDATERVTLYRRAIELAAAYGLPTLSTRLALAEVLIHGLGNSAAALAQLDACGQDAPDGDEIERKQWASLLEDAAVEAADDAERALMFQRAMDIATAHGRPTLRLCLLLVRFLLDTGRSVAARQELQACAGEAADGDEEDRAFWTELCAEVGAPEPGATADPRR